jgi:hypothetical protein
MLLVNKWCGKRCPEQLYFGEPVSTGMLPEIGCNKFQNSQFGSKGLYHRLRGRFKDFLPET